VREQRPDYVEYRLTGLFFGLMQEVLARGGPVDADHYWYEFITAVARMRVEGRLAGEDGNLTQTEVITFQFTASRRFGHDVILLRYRDQGHGFTGEAMKDFWDREMAFFAKYLKASAILAVSE